MCVIYTYKYHTYFLMKEYCSLLQPFSHLFLHNLRVLYVNLPENVLYLETFTLKLAKHKMATKMLRKPHIFYSFSQINAQFVVSARFLIVNFFLVSLEIN